MKIGLTYDLREAYLAEGYDELETAEFDRADTIDSLENAIRSLGHQTDRIGHVRQLVSRLAAGDRWDLVFNICEGLRGIAREAQVPAPKTLAEFVAHAQANPGKLNYASTGIGTSSHLSGFVLAKRAPFEATHVPYKGAEALRDLLAGRVQFMFATIPSVIAHINSGGLRAIAVTSIKRSRSMPDVPTVADSGFPGFEAGSWVGYFAPKGTPAPVIATLNKAVNEILDVPAVQAQLIKEGADPAGGTPAQFATFVQREYEKWKVIVQESGARAE